MSLTKSTLARSTLTRIMPVPFLLAFIAPSGHAQLPPPAARLITSVPIVIDPLSHRVYAADPENNRIVVLDPARAITTYIPVLHQPVALALDSAAARLYVVNAASGMVSVLDTNTVQEVAQLQTDTHPYTLALDATRHRLYVTNTFSNELTIIDGHTNQVTRHPLGSKDALAIDEPHHRVYLSSYEDSDLLVLDEVSGVASKLPAAVHTWALAVDPDSGTLYAVIIGSNQVLIFPGGTGAPVHIPTGSMPDAIALDQAAHRVYIANRESSTITIVDTATQQTLATVPVGKHPQALVIDPVRHCLYSANTASNTVSVIDEASNKLVATLPAGHAPYALALDAGTGTVYAADLGKPAFTQLPRSGCKP